MCGISQMHLKGSDGRDMTDSSRTLKDIVLRNKVRNWHPFQKIKHRGVLALSYFSVYLKLWAVLYPKLLFLLEKCRKW